VHNKSIVSKLEAVKAKAKIEPELRKVLTPKEPPKPPEEPESPSPQKDYFNWKLWLIIIAGIMIAINGVIFGRLSQQIRWLSRRISKLAGKLNYGDIEGGFNQLQQDYRRCIEELKKKLQTVEDELQQLKNLIQTTGVPPKIEKPVVKSNVIYLKTKSGDYLYHESDNQENSKFKLFDINGDKAKFEFCGNEQSAIDNKNSIFDNVCEYSNYSSGVTHITNIEPGEVYRQHDGRWKVIKKAKIKFS
jgi:hypothetical protein